MVQNVYISFGDRWFQMLKIIDTKRKSFGAPLRKKFLIFILNFKPCRVLNYELFCREQIWFYNVC